MEEEVMKAIQLRIQLEDTVVISIQVKPNVLRSFQLTGKQLLELFDKN